MKRFIVLMFLGGFLLSSCSSPVVEETKQTKTPFSVKVVSLNELKPIFNTEKTGRITASSTLTLSAQWVGEINKIAVKEWQYVKAGALIASLKDTQTNYDLRLEQAENALVSQDASIKTTAINLGSALENARISYERAKQAYETLTSKNALQYDSVVNSNAKTLKTYNENFKTYLSDVEKNMTQILYEGDRILGMTTAFQYTVDGWKSYLGAKVGNARADSENSWNKLYGIRGEIRARAEKWTNINIDDAQTDFAIIAKGYDETRKYIDIMVYMLQNNAIGAGLSQEMQNGWMAAWNGYRSAIGWAEAGFNGWKSQTITFLDGYKNTEIATRLAVESQNRSLTKEEQNLIDTNTDLRITYQNLRLTLSDQIKNAKLSLEQADSAYKNAKSILDATLVQLEASKKSAQIALEQAKRDYAKLRVVAPVDGNIWKITANVWQSVNIGSPIAEFTSNQPQISVDVDTELAETLSPGESVSIAVDDTTLSGTITAISRIAGNNLLSPVRITVLKWEKYIGQSAVIRFAFGERTQDDRIFLPINAVKIISEEEGEISVLSASGSISKTSVKLGQVSGTNIEILTEIEKTAKIIITDISNYDETKNTLTITQ